MRLRICLLLTIATVLGFGMPCHAACDSQTLSAAQKAAVADGVRAFLVTVAHNVTQEGPSAWRKHFLDDPAFFMAVNGRLVFSDSQSTTQGIQDAARMIKHIELTWGNDLRIDPLTPNLAVVATSFSEIQTSAEGKHITETGFFTGIAEYRSGRWQFRDAHWSDNPPPKAQ
jgi:hypothetical protein